MKDNKEIKKILFEFFNLWDLEVENIDSKDRYNENIEMFNYIINIQLEFISLKKDQIIKLHSNDQNKMYQELYKFENSNTYKKFMNINNYAMRLQSDYKKLYTLKQRRAKENIFLRNELTKKQLK